MEIGNICAGFLIKSDMTNNTLISGYASVFGVIDNQNDIIEKGAFEAAIAADVKLLWQHDSLKPIGVINSIYEDDYGLKMDAEINNNVSFGKEASELVKQKALKGLSIGFSIKDFAYNDQGVRLIKKIDLMEVSIVTFPANAKAGITYVKALETKSNPLDRLEKLVQTLVSLKKA